MFYCRFYLFCAIQVVLAHGVHLLGIGCDFFGYSGQMGDVFHNLIIGF